MRSRLALMALGLSAWACSRHAAPERASAGRDSSVPATASVTEMQEAGTAPDGGPDGDSASALPPLGGSAVQVEFLDGREKLGFVSVPLGATTARPIMIAIHGGSDKPELACAAWRTITEGYPFVVCPRGFGGNSSALGWRTTADTTARIDRAVNATRALFRAWMRETDSVVLAGFSMGGSQVALLARAEPKRYRRIAVGDSAHDPQPALTFSRAWAHGGGERAIFLCTTSGCEPSFRAAARNVAREKAPARLVIAPTQVHGLSERVAQSMRRDWPWLVDGAAGWEGYVAPDGAALPGTTETFEPSP